MQKIPIFLTLDQLQGDLTQFLQQSIVFKSDQPVVVYLDTKPEFFHNPEIKKYYEEHLIYELDTNLDKPALPEVVPVLTLAGVVEVRNQVLVAFETKHPYAENRAEDIDWK